MAATAESPFQYVERVPTAELDDVVEAMWFLRAPSPQRYEKILPLPYLHLIINLGEPYRILDHGGTRLARVVDGAFVSGIQSTYLINENPHLIHHVGVRIRPAGFGAFSATAVGSSSENATVVDAAALLPGITDLRETLALAPTPDAALTAVEQALVAWRRPEFSVDPALAAALALIDSDPTVTMAAVARAVDVTPKRLIGLFTRGCGITPKRYADVVRHFRFLGQVPDEPPFPTWSELSAAAGYYDQPHFIRAFTRCTGMTPREYLAAKREFAGSASSFLAMDSLPS